MVTFYHAFENEKGRFFNQKHHFFFSENHLYRCILMPMKALLGRTNKKNLFFSANHILNIRYIVKCIRALYL